MSRSGPWGSRLPCASQRRRTLSRIATIYPPGALVETDWPTDRAFAAGCEVRTLFVGAEEESDLGYSYGDITAPAAASVVPVARAVFVRIWQREGRRWRVALDMLTALVEEEEP